ncbi:MAG: hypothetical protein QOJ98_1338 [Acidobacteriota bacterium]|jgi:hypothetical protein|nr:hypothetical protein [Acidobacteriota bacterium]
MSKVTVQFFGICTHVTLADAEGSHRVILVNASKQDEIDKHELLKKEKVKAHFARVQLEQGRFDGTEHPWFRREAVTPEAVAWGLDGVVVSFDGATGVAPEGPGSTSCIPSLSKFTHDDLVLRGRYGEADESVTACLVDLPPVTVIGRNWEDGAAVGIVTLSFPEAPTMRVTPFDPLKTPVELVLRPGAVVTVSNYPKVMTPSTEKDPDFLLHFLATSHVPAHAWFPREPTGCIREPVPTNPPIVEKPAYAKGMSGPGCSNSTYP